MGPFQPLFSGERDTFAPMDRSLTDRDRHVIWHPYTQHKGFLPPIPIVRGKDTLLFDDTGKPYIDAISSWWVNIHGHAHPYIAEKIYRQALQLEHVIFTGFTHEPAVALAERLLPLLPGDFSRVFYSDNGSTAVEVAIKMAIQYWGNKRDSRHDSWPIGDLAGPASSGRLSGQRQKILAFHHSYHGDTFGAMSVSERGLFTDAFRDYLFEPIFIDPPSPENIEALLAIVREQGPDIACIIYEPLLQAAGGMRLYDAASMDLLLDELAKQDILVIADEVLTGFGRTGKRFAGEYLQHKADIICLSKGLTGGTMALGVTASTETRVRGFPQRRQTADTLPRPFVYRQSAGLFGRVGQPRPFPRPRLPATHRTDRPTTHRLPGDDPPLSHRPQCPFTGYRPGLRAQHRC